MSGIGVLLALGILALALAAHPFVTYPLSLWLFAPRRAAGVARATERPSVAICMCAYNEEAVVVDKVHALLATAALYGPATVHVYVDGSTDRTAELLRPLADRIDLVISPERFGKTHGMNLLIDRSRSDLVMFSDANVIAPPDLLSGLATPFADPETGCVTATLAYSNPAESPTSLAGTIYWAVEERIKAIEAATIGVIGVDGACFLVRRALYQPAPDGLIDDFYVTLKVLIAGAHVQSVADVVVEERSAVDPVEERNRKQRIACQALNVHKALWPELRRLPAWQLYGYLSHRLIKWMMPFSLAAALACFAAAAILATGWPAAAAIAIGAAAIAIGGRFDLPVLGVAATALLSLYGVGRGFCQSLFSQTSYTTWEPAKSVRSAPINQTL
jgi:cellulose synthase/poly-beta-1,6-N-acetylglucosamine synthase-like glycosyltransferase